LAKSAGTSVTFRKKRGFDFVIPGHGPVNTKANLLTYRNNVEQLRTRAAGLIREGKSQEEVGKVMMAEFGWLRTGCRCSGACQG
jgi:hypothetical protein